MDNRMEAEGIDAKELLLYILRKWRILIIAGLAGIVLGAGMQMITPEKSIDDLEMDKLHLKEIGQYARYQQLYDEQIEKEADSVYMNMDPHQVHSGQKVYYISAYESDMNRIGEGYSAILRDSQIYDELARISGLGCTEREIHELVSVWFGRYEKGEIDPLFGDVTRSGKVTIYIKSPNEEACDSMMEYLDARVAEVNEYFAANLEGFSYEVISNTCSVGYDAGVVAMRSDSAELLDGYVKDMADLKNKLTEDDLLYYSEVYAVDEEEEEGGLGWLKWGIVIGVLFGGLMTAFYGMKFLLNGHVKSLDELKRQYGLSLLAIMAAEKDGKRHSAVDRLLETKYEYNTDEYLRTSVDVMKKNRIQLCGDMKNAEIAAKLNLFAGDADVVVCDRFAVDARAQRAVSETDGVVLFVQLWKTKHAELVRELETCYRLGQKVLGVVVIG